MTLTARARATLALVGGGEMRRRVQRRGDLSKKSGAWRLRYRTQVVTEDGILRTIRPNVLIGPATGPARLTKGEAERIAWDNYLSKINELASPQSACTLERFVRTFYWPHIVATTKTTTQRHVDTRLRTWVLPVLGSEPLRSITPLDIQRVAQAPLAAGRSVQTAYHVKNILSGIFTRAKAIGHYAGENPARMVKLRPLTRKEGYAYSFEEARRLLEMLASPVHEAVWLALTTSLRVGELRGLVWRRANLSPEPSTVGGESLPPCVLAVRQQFQLGAYQTVKAGKSRRNVPLSRSSVALLTALRARTPFPGPDDPIFASRRGTPIDTHNVSNRAFRKLKELLKFPVAWHAFRHSHITWLGQTDMSVADRLAQAGHADAGMMLHYSHGDLERRRGPVEAIDAALVGDRGRIQ